MKRPEQGEVDAREYFAVTMLEKGTGGLQEAVEGLAKTYRWLYYHTHDSRDSVEGFPDLVMIRAGVQIFAELKRQAAELTAAQQAWRRAIEQVSAFTCSGALPMHQRLVQYWLWRPMDLLDGSIEAVLR